MLAFSINLCVSSCNYIYFLSVMCVFDFYLMKLLQVRTKMIEMVAKGLAIMEVNELFSGSPASLLAKGF